MGVLRGSEPVNAWPRGHDLGRVLANASVRRRSVLPVISVWSTMMARPSLATFEVVATKTSFSFPPVSSMPGVGRRRLMTREIDFLVRVMQYAPTCTPCLTKFVPLTLELLVKSLEIHLVNTPSSTASNDEVMYPLLLGWIDVAMEPLVVLVPVASVDAEVEVRGCNLLVKCVPLKL